jgi:hypothetical protein
LIKEIKGSDGMGAHQQTFIDAIRNNAPDSLNAPVEIGHQSSAWCNFANYAYRIGNEGFARGQGTMEGLNQSVSDSATAILEELRKLVAVHEGDEIANSMRLGPTLEFDPQAEEFVGTFGDTANQLLRRNGRNEFVVPEM